MTDPRVYRILDTEQKIWWSTPRGKTIWTGMDTAMAAWNNQHSPYAGVPVFSKQTRFELRAFKIQSV